MKKSLLNSRTSSVDGTDLLRFITNQVLIELPNDVRRQQERGIV